MDLHLQTAEHAQHTTKPLCGRVVSATIIKYAQGRTINHTLGYDIHIETPMDFMRYPCGAFFAALTWVPVYCPEPQIDWSGQ